MPETKKCVDDDHCQPYVPPRLNSLVKFDFDSFINPEEKVASQHYINNYLKVFKRFDLKTREGVYIYIGDIAQMPGHCIVLDYKTERIISGYHTDNFIELTEDEV